jgi:recombination associated protein RdgC
MLFRNLTLFRFAASATPDPDALERALAERTLRPVGALELSTQGWVSPFGPDSEVLVLRQGHQLLLQLGAEDKLLPGSVVQAELATRLRAYEAEHGRRPGGKLRRQMREDLVSELLPRAFARPSRLWLYLDLKQGWLGVDSASRKAAEAAVGLLRDCLGSFPALPATADSAPRERLTRWLGKGELPKDFALGDECELKDPSDKGGVVRARRQDLASEEMHEHLKAGKQVSQLALIYDGRLGVVLGDDLVLRKIRYLEVADEAPESGEDAAQELEARFALSAGEIARLLARLEDLFGVARPAQNAD